MAGLVLTRQQPGTAKGIRFITLEDETGIANLMVRQDVCNRYRCLAAGASSLLVSGKLQKVGSIIHVLVSKLEDLSQVLAGLKAAALAAAEPAFAGLSYDTLGLRGLPVVDAASFAEAAR